MSATRLGARLTLRGGAAARPTTTMVDQCLASGSNFAVGIVVARVGGPAGLGAFALAYTVWILVTLIYRALITAPMMILGDTRRDDRDEFVRLGFAASVILSLMAACIITAVGTALLVVGQHTFGVALLSVAPWILMLNLQDYWRQVGFMEGNPRKSLMNDLVFNAVQAAAFVVVFLVGLHSVFAVVSAWGFGAAVAAVYGFRQFSVHPSIHGAGAFLWSRWPMSRWLVSERTAGWAASQLYLILAGALLGPTALGGLKASQALVSGPTSVVVNAGGSFGLPEASRQLDEHGWKGMARVSRFVTGSGVLVAGACCVAILLAAPTLLRVLYGPEFVVYAPSLRIFAVSAVFGALGVGPVLKLTTTLRVRPLFVLQLGGLAFSVAAVRVLVIYYGVTGAAMAALLTSIFLYVVSLVLVSSARRSVEETQGRPVDETQGRPAARFFEIVRGRISRNAKLVFVLPQERSSSACSPPCDS